jgi:hypothetical protein
MSGKDDKRTTRAYRIHGGDEERTFPQSQPEYWIARRRRTGEVEPVEVWRSTNPTIGDIVCPPGEDEAYEPSYWDLIHRVSKH